MPREPLPWGDLRAVKEGRVTWTDVRRGLQQVAAAHGSWAGMPLPLADQQLILEPKYPLAKEVLAVNSVFNALGSDVQTREEHEAREEAKFAGWRNRFWSFRYSSEIIIWNTTDGKIQWGKVPGVHSGTQQLATLGCHDAWDLATEEAAMQTLKRLVPPHIYKMYVMTGQFLETSKRSGVTYVFRRLRPTIAIKADKRTGNMRILCSLCLHPVGYYAGTYAGAMVPTDDVIAHLMLSRGDERLFWARANQHAPYRPEAGI